MGDIHVNMSSTDLAVCAGAHSSGLAGNAELGISSI